MLYYGDCDTVSWGGREPLRLSLHSFDMIKIPFHLLELFAYQVPSGVL